MRPIFLEYDIYRTFLYLCINYVENCILRRGDSCFDREIVSSRTNSLHIRLLLVQIFQIHFTMILPPPVGYIEA